MILPIRGQPWRSWQRAVEVAVHRGAKRPEFLAAYAENLWRDCATLGIRADVAWAQADVETGNRQTGVGFQSDRWVKEGNPAGLGVVDNLPDGTPVHTFTPESAARIHATHLAGYAGIAPPQAWVEMDFRWKAMLREGYYGVARDTNDLSGRWATGRDYGPKIEGRWSLYGFTEPQKEQGNMAIAFGNVPMYGHRKRILSNREAVEGKGWNNLGKRTPKFVALHRMVGTLWGTDGYFRNPAVASLTDYGIGIESVDGKANAGVILQWNDPEGYRAGWASGPVSKPYGDGLCIVNKYGINAVNRDGVSLEISGTNQVIDEFSWNEIVHFCAWWADHLEIPYTALPLNPHTGCNFLIWHNEFTDGTGKECPFTWMRNNTNRLYRDVISLLKKYQESSVPVPQPEPQPEPIPEPTWMPPAPVKELALADPADADSVDHLTVVNGHKFRAIFDGVVPIRRTRQYRFAYPDAPDTFEAGDALPNGVHVIGPDLTPAADGEDPTVLEAMYLFIADDGRDWYYLSNHARVLAADFQRVRD